MQVLLLISSLVVLTAGSPPLQVEVHRGFPLRPQESSLAKSQSQSQHLSIKAPLPRNNVMPVHYNVHLTPVIDAGEGGFEQYSIPGKVTINVTAITATNTITLNALDLDVEESTLTLRPEDPLDTTAYTVTGRYERENEFYVLLIQPQIQAGKSYEIYMEFTSYIATTKLNGIYLTGYTDPDTNQFANVLTTQFEASAARQAFPCFDEPWVKATFKFHIGYDAGKYIALCNGEALAEIPHPEMPAGWKLKEFESTVKMSAYLIAIVIADYTYAEAQEGIFNKPVKVYGPPHLMREPNNGGEYSATKGAEFLAYFEEYFGIEYKMQKMDSVAVPAFWFGAMENWGLNFYRETLLMYFNKVSTEAERESITSVLAHELVHQWFGNLVTAEYWNHIWLNEGFATYFSPIATAEVNPEFHSLTTRQYEVAQRALAFDATTESHPLINSAHGNHSYDTLMEVFDRITYEKAGSLIRMMEGFLTPATMKQGLINYLIRLSFHHADQDDLFLILTEQGHTDGTLSQDRTVKDIMDTWSHQSGFPLVRVTKSTDSRIFVSQERFVNRVEYSDESTLDPNELWTIPVATATAANPDFTNLGPDFWIEKDVAVKVLNDYDASKWILVNADGIGYYRVLYDPPLLDLLLSQLSLNSSVISTKSKSQLIDDYFTFVAHKFTAIENALSLTKYLEQESEAGVWLTVFSHLRGILNKLSGTEASTAFERYMTPRVGAALDTIGLEQLPTDRGTKVVLRSQLLDWACTMGHQQCLDYASIQFDQWEASPLTNPIPVDIRPVMYCGAVRNGDNSTFATALERYSSPQTSAKDRPLFLNALACANNPSLPLAILENLLLDTSEIGAADKITFLQRLGANSDTRTQTTGFIQQRTPEVIQVLGVDSVSRYVGTLATYVGTQSELQQIETIMADNTEALETVLPTLEAHLVTIRSNIQWRNENEERLEIWFSEN